MSIESVLAEKKTKVIYRNAVRRLFSPAPIKHSSDEDLNAKFLAFHKQESRRQQSQLRNENEPSQDECLDVVSVSPLSVVRRAGVAVTGTTMVTVGVPLVIVPVPGPGE